MAQPPKPLTVKIELQIDNHDCHFSKQVIKTTKISDLLAQVKGSLSESQRQYEFFMTNDGMPLKPEQIIGFYGIDDGDTIKIKAERKSMIAMRQSVVVPKETDYQSIYLNSEKVGILYKKKMTTMSGWRKRWVVYCRGHLFYYKDPRNDVCIGKIPINSTNVQFIGSDGERSCVFRYEAKGSIYHFSCENEEEYISWKKVLNDGEPCVISTVAMKMLQESTAFSVVTFNKNKKVWLMMNSGTIFSYESPNNMESLFEFFIHESKILTVDATREFTFVHLNDRKTIKFGTQQEYEKWKRLINDTISLLGLNLYTNSFITDEYKDPKNILKEGYMFKEKMKLMQTKKRRYCILTKNKLFYFNSQPDPKSTRTNPYGCFDLLLTHVEMKTVRGEEVLEIKTNEGVYQFTTQKKEELSSWADLIQRECTGAPTNVQHLQHVGFDFEWDTSGIDPNQIFNLGDVIGTGSFGTVYHAVHRQSNFEMAIKVLTVNKQQSEELKSEIDILKKCRSPNVVSYYGTIKIDEKTLWILMDMCGVGSVKDLMKRTKENLNEEQLRYVLNETLKGLVYLHSIKIIHHDIKAGNLLLTNDGKVKLADFGVSQQQKDDEKEKKANDFIGSPLFMSPEVIQKSSYDQRTDIWSLGITVIEMAEGNAPNRHVTSFDQLLKTIQAKSPTFKNPKQWSEQIVDFVAQCLIFQFTERPDAMNLLWHPFIVSQSPPVADSLMSLINQ